MEAYTLLLNNAARARQRYAQRNEAPPPLPPPPPLVAEEKTARVVAQTLPEGFYQNPYKDSMYMGYVPPPRASEHA